MALDIASLIGRLAAALSDIRDALEAKGVAAEDHGYEEVAEDIASIQTGGTYQSKTVVPQSVPYTVTPDTGYDALSSVTMGKYPTLLPANIKSGTNIYGVVGTYTGEGKTYQSKTATPGASQQIILPDTGYDALSQVTVSGDANLTAGNIRKDVQIFGTTGTYEGEAGNYQSKDIIPASLPLTVTPDTGYDALSSVTIEPYPTLLPANIRDGVIINGVLGTFTNTGTQSSGQLVANASKILSGYSAWADGAEVKGSILSKAAETITPSTTDIIAIPAGLYASGHITVKGDENLLAENIKKNIQIFGVTGTYEGGGSGGVGSLIVCTCSSNITEVRAVYGGVTVNAYKVGDTAYMNVPYQYTGAVTVEGDWIDYDAGGVTRTTTTSVTITDIDLYTCSIIGTSIIYNAGVWNVDHTYDGLSAHLSAQNTYLWKADVSDLSTTFRITGEIGYGGAPNVYHYEKSTCYITPAISTNGYQKIRFVVKRNSNDTAFRVGYCTSTPAPSYYWMTADEEIYAYDTGYKTLEVDLPSSVTPIYIAFELYAPYAGPSSVKLFDGSAEVAKIELV